MQRNIMRRDGPKWATISVPLHRRRSLYLRPYLRLSVSLRLYLPSTSVTRCTSVLTSAFWSSSNSIFPLPSLYLRSHHITSISCFTSDYALASIYTSHPLSPSRINCWKWLSFHIMSILKWLQFSVVKKTCFWFFFILKKRFFFSIFFVFYYFYFFFIFYQSYDCVVSPSFVNRVYFSTHNSTHNDENSSNFQNQKLIDETDHIKVRVFSQIGTKLYTSSL